MPSGLQVYNADGALIVDSETIGLGLIKSGKLQHVWPRAAELSPVARDLIYTSQVTVANATNPIIFFGGGNLGAWVQTVRRIGNTWDIVINCAPMLYTNFGSGFVADYPNFYVFDAMSAGPETFGIETFDAIGRLVFSSSRYPLKVVYAETMPPPDGFNNWAYNDTPYSGFVYASASANNRVRDVLPPGSYAVNFGFGRVGVYSSDDFSNTTWDMSEYALGTSTGFATNFLGGRTDYFADGTNGFHGMLINTYGLPRIVVADVTNIPLNVG